LANHLLQGSSWTSFLSFLPPSSPRSHHPLQGHSVTNVERQGPDGVIVLRVDLLAPQMNLSPLLDASPYLSPTHWFFGYPLPRTHFFIWRSYSLSLSHFLFFFGSPPSPLFHLPPPLWLAFCFFLRAIPAKSCRSPPLPMPSSRRGLGRPPFSQSALNPFPLL